MKTLPPQRLTDSTWADVEKQLKRIFFDILFAPLIGIINRSTAQKVELKNAAPPRSFTALLEAIKSGRIQYANGIFTGQFNVSISNALRLLGARFDSHASTYSIPPGILPGWVKAEAANYQMNAKATHDELKRKLDEVQLRLDERLSEYTVDADDVLQKIQSGFRESAKALNVQPRLDDQHSEQLSRDYNQNIKLYIKNFAEEEISSLRESVEKNAMRGYRFDNLKDMIQQRYGVTGRKAKFLARQETALFMSKYREQRFSQAGVTTYKWSTAHDERVRDDHKRLNGRVFSYDQPPITDRSTGARNSPGQDFNCRCLDIPILDKVVSFHE